MRIWQQKPRLIGAVLYLFMRFIRATLRVSLYKHPSIDPNKAYLFACWHGKILLPSLIVPDHHHTPLCVMVSPSRDGGVLTDYLSRFGYDFIRSSSRKNNIAGLIQMRQKLLSGASVGTAIDGPIGPIYVVKPGIPYLAQKYGVPIIPVSSAFSRNWTFNKAWDKFQFPKPFAKGAVVLGEPYIPPANVDIDQICTDLEIRLQQVGQQAIDMLEAG